MRLTTCVQQFFDLYHFRIKGSSQQTIKAYREALALFLPFVAKYYSIKVGSLSIDHLSLQVILSFLDYLQSDRSNAANTRNQRLAVIKSLAKMIRLMYPQKWEIADIILAIPQKKSQKKIVAFLYIEEIFAAYEAVDLKKPLGFRDYTILHLLADSGARATEIATLNLDYFNPTQKTLTILGKANKFRLIKLDQKTIDLVKRYITRYRPNPKPIYQHSLFINKHGRPLTRKGIYLMCQKYLSVALKPKRLKMIHPVHSFRHACAINMLASGKSLSDIKNHLGHENIESTMIYLKMDLRTKRAVQKKFIEYSQSTLKHDPKIDELIDWEHKKETLAWLDSL
ncbi:MAG: tyrosine-type recombinase/integrase [Deltaproteobacteria bacterium]|nr:tyrosine-type recombinase/integrase [Deltaproteobacteria bacterium]